MIFQKSLLSTVVALGCLAMFLGHVAAQDNAPRDPTPRSTGGGYSGQQLRQLYRSDVGRGFSVNSVNSMSLQRSQASVPYVGQSTTSYGRDRIDLGVSPSSVEKPFSNTSSRPAVSPYLNLFRDDLDGSGDFNYQTLVRPQLQQQQLNEQFQSQAQAIAQRVQQISARPAYNQQGAQNVLPTGHQTVFGYHGRFYPSMNARR
jgi:hypothetical protein